jgi:hypothetical protein
LYVRQLAWLYAVPQLPPATREAAEKAGQKIDPNKISRLDEMVANKVTPPLPPNPMPHLTGWLMQLGIVEAAGMGAAPVSWTEIEAWQRLTGIRLTPWEASLMRSLSACFLAQKPKSELTTDPAPCSIKVSTSGRSADEAALDALFG